jgi:hypothetical protein
MADEAFYGKFRVDTGEKDEAFHGKFRVDYYGSSYTYDSIITVWNGSAWVNVSESTNVYNSTWFLRRLKLWNGSAWVNVGAQSSGGNEAFHGDFRVDTGEKDEAFHGKFRVDTGNETQTFCGTFNIV